MKKENTYKKLNNEGFSLVELIIVIAILAILAAIITPNLLKYSEKARRARDLDTAKVMYTTFERILAIDPKAAEEWANIGAGSNSVYGFKVTDYDGNKYVLANIFEYTMTKKGDIAQESIDKWGDNTRYGVIRDATATGGYKGDAWYCKDQLIDEISTNFDTKCYKGQDLRGFRIAKNMTTGMPEVWASYVPPNSDGEGKTNGYIQYRLYPNTDPRYLGLDEAAPKFQNGPGRTYR